MAKNYCRYLIFLYGFFMLATSTVHANTTIEPDSLIKTTIYNLITDVQASRSTLKSNPEHIKELVLTHIAPQLDFIAAARWVLGKHWTDTSREQKVRFIKQFRKLLIQFYSAALSEYALNNNIEHNIISVLPLRQAHDGKDTTVYSIVSPPNSTKKVKVNYHMHNTRKGWKIYDVAVEGISMITTYKSSFAPQLRSLGVEGLTNSLIERNTKLAANEARKTAPKRNSN